MAVPVNMAVKGGHLVMRSDKIHRDRRTGWMVGSADNCVQSETCVLLIYLCS